MNITDAQTHAETLWLDSTVTYKGTTVNARVHQPEVNGHIHRRYVEVSVDDIDEPNYRDTFTIDGVDWKVYRTSDNHDGEPMMKMIGGFWLVPLYRDERPNNWI